MVFIKNFFRVMYFLKSQGAVSEVTDFVLLVGILVFSLSIIGIAGYPILKNAQTSIFIENSKQSFIVLASNINKVALGQAPSQSMELKMYGGTLSVTGKSTINITAKNSTGQRITLVDQQMRSIESSVGDVVIAYEGTGAWARYPDSAQVNLYKPIITGQGDALIIPVVYINGNSYVAGSGIRKVTVKGVPEVTFYSNMSNLTLKINSSYSDSWRNYYTNIMSWDNCSDGGCTVQLNTPNMDIYILNIQMDTVIE